MKGSVFQNEKWLALRILHGQFYVFPITFSTVAHEKRFAL